MENVDKKVLIGIICGVVIIAVGVILFFVLQKDNVYRLLKIYEVSGKALVTRDKTEKIEPYANMVLESGDRVALDEGSLTICADKDKYIYLEENTELVLNASGTAKDSKTTIELVKGAITNDIENKLSSKSSYEINTPNSTMSVRGTIYRVYIYEEDGIKYTRVSVFDGEVETRLVYSNGEISEEAVSVQKGKEVLIYDDGKVTDYVSDPKDIDYDSLPDTVIKLLIKLTDYNRDVSTTKSKLKKILFGPFTVKFMYNGEEFGSQEINRGEKAEVPGLQPEQEGSWNFDFSTPIKRNTTIEWESAGS